MDSATRMGMALHRTRHVNMSPPGNWCSRVKWALGDDSWGFQERRQPL